MKKTGNHVVAKFEEVVEPLAHERVVRERRFCRSGVRPLVVVVSRVVVAVVVAASTESMR